MTDTSGIHEEHPFVLPVEERDPVRRFRGRLAAPVTIVTSGEGSGRAGLTISSLVVAEGDPAVVYFLVGSMTDLFAAIEVTGKFVVHVCDTSHRVLADVFAGIRPSPGGPFSGRSVEQSDWGPCLTTIESRAYCTYSSGDEETYSVLASGTVDRLELHELSDPLVYFRGRYRGLDSLRVID